MGLFILKKRHEFRRFLSCCNIRGLELNQKLKHEIDKFWANQVTQTNFDHYSTKPKYYVLSMFPYPSGKLHMGHVRVYAVSDTMARYHRMCGKNVIHPIGWDAFGLPAENAAIEHKIEPQEWTKQNIGYMKEQLKKLNCSFDWDREISTCDPNYYKWTQFIFLKLHKAGLVYQKEAVVNWDPVDQTVLADEQVDESGHSWRSGALVEKKLLKQWFIRTTEFAKDLLEGLNDSILHDWRDILKIQKHWIGDCLGVNFNLNIISDGKETGTEITVWLTKPEEILNLDFIVLSPNNLICKNLSKNSFVTNPFNNRQIPIFVNGLPEDNVSQVHLGYLNDETEYTKHILEQFGSNLMETREKFYFRDENEALKVREDILNKARTLNIGGYWTSQHLRDWLISRQRYWGTPIPMIHCVVCGPVPVPETELPVLLPRMEEREIWRHCQCPKCGKDAKRETDSMDTFVDSSWYYIRYLDPKNSENIVDKEIADKLYPVDLYIGGKEHACLHLYYARFMSHFLHRLKIVPEKEPFKRLLVQGMVKGESYQLEKSQQYLHKDQVEFDPKTKDWFQKSTREKVICSWEKMSKSKYNGVDPNDVIDEYGVDTTRLLILADVAPMSHRNWSTKTFPGVLNWQNRLWLTVRNFFQTRENLPDPLDAKKLQQYEDQLFDSRNFYIRMASFNFEVTQQISVAISKLQGLTNDLRKVPEQVSAYSVQFERALAVQLIMLAPIAPSFASELWSHFVSAPNRLTSDPNEINFDGSVLDQNWPILDANYKLDMSCQFNNEEIKRIKVPKYVLDGNSIEEIEKYVTKEKKIRSFLDGDKYQFKYTDLQSFKPTLYIVKKQNS